MNKKITQQKIAEYHESGDVAMEEAVIDTTHFSFYTSKNLNFPNQGDLSSIITGILKYVQKNEYLAINAYLPRDGETESIFQKLQEKVIEETGCATTVGFGPRFLHSTGNCIKVDRILEFFWRSRVMRKQIWRSLRRSYLSESWNISKH